MSIVTGTTTFVDALEALVARLPAVVGVNVQVLDGPAVTYQSDDFIAVGFSDQSTPAGRVSRAEPDLGLSPVGGEQGDIVCVASSYSGDPDYGTLRHRVADIVSAVNGLLRGDPDLGGAVSVAYLGDAAEWSQRPVVGDENNVMGFAVECAFFVHYESFV